MISFMLLLTKTIQDSLFPLRLGLKCLIQIIVISIDLVGVSCGVVEGYGRRLWCDGGLFVRMLILFVWLCFDWI